MDSIYLKKPSRWEQITEERFLSFFEDQDLFISSTSQAYAIKLKENIYISYLRKYGFCIVSSKIYLEKPTTCQILNSMEDLEVFLDSVAWEPKF